jgi:hypothetical protein
MTTLRAYLNMGQALTAKAHLEAEEIPCALADENAHLYGGAPFAMPIRLLVPDSYSENADRVLRDLSNDLAEGWGEPVATGESSLVAPETSNNPWEVLVLALVFFAPGLALLLRNEELVLSYGWSRRYNPVLSAHEVHLLGLVPITVAILVVIFYFRLRGAIRRDDALT